MTCNEPYSMPPLFSSQLKKKFFWIKVIPGKCFIFQFISNSFSSFSPTYDAHVGNEKDETRGIL